MPIDQPLAQTTAESPRLTALIGNLKALLTDPTDRARARRDAVFVFFVRASSAAVLYLSQIVLARLMGASEYGIYVWAWTLVLVIGGMSHLGLGMALIRLIPTYRENGQLDVLRGLLIGSRWLALFSGSAIALCLYFAVKFDLFDLDDHRVVPALLAIVCIPLFAMTDVQDGLGRAQGWLSIALVPPYVLRPVVLLVVMALAFSVGLPMDASMAVFAAIVACWAAAMVQTLMVQGRLDAEIPKGPRRYQFGTWIRASLPLLVLYAGELVIQNADVLVLSAYATPTTVGMYFAAAKTMSLVMFVHYAVGSVVAKDFATLHARGDRAALADYARDAVRWTFWPSLAAAIVILMLGRPLLWLFSPDFLDAYSVMLVLVAGFLFKASVGPAEFLLSAMGEQKACAAIAVSVAVLDIALNLALVPPFGMMGAASATAISLALGAVLFAITARRKTGIAISIWQIIRAKA
jgi:O-antigen/teichoic acid export membrane protein